MRFAVVWFKVGDGSKTPCSAAACTPETPKRRIARKAHKTSPKVSWVQFVPARLVTPDLAPPGWLESQQLGKLADHRRGYGSHQYRLRGCGLQPAASRPSSGFSFSSPHVSFSRTTEKANLAHLNRSILGQSLSGARSII